MSSLSYEEETADSTSEKKKEGKQTQQKVAITKLFAFADFYDYVLMGLGSIGAIAHGASVPVFFIFFGKLINIIGMAYLFPKQASHRVAMVCVAVYICIS
uniref:ABC transporter B family member 2-like n=1 Tax=Rhizophora mucronata TaxID=61149 RepID=A0A2P2K8Z8_RHIMU